MSHAVTRNVMDNCPIKGQRRSVMMALAHYADDTGDCWPSQRTLAHDAAMTERGIQKIMDALVLAGEVEIVEKGNGRGNSTHYRLVKYARKGEQEPSKGRTICSSFEKEERANGDTLKGERIAERANGLPLKGEQLVPPNTNRIPLESKKNTTMAEIPDALKTPEFLTAWSEFKTHRKQKKKPMTELAEQKQIRIMEQWGVARAIAAIDHSISNGWTGIFEPRQNPQHKQPAARPIFRDCDIPGKFEGKSLAQMMEESMKEEQE